MPSSSKRARRQDRDSGRSTPASSRESTSVSQIHQMFQDYKESVIRMVLADLPRLEGSANLLPCPFQRRNPHRYVNVRDPACNGRGFKDIADLRDHIKRAHSSRYGCHYCKERFQGRDNAVEETAAAHRAKCKRYAARDVAEVSLSKPEVMSPDDDKRYFRLDFRKKPHKDSSSDRQYEQYWEICKAIWPEYESRHAFEQLDLRNKAGAIPVSRLSEIMNKAMCEVDVDQFISSTSPSSSSQYSDPQPHYSERTSALSLPTSSSYSLPHHADQHQQAVEHSYDDLVAMHAIPQPVRYAERAHQSRDSAYGSNSQTDESNSNSNCYRYGFSYLGEQMLTDDDHVQMDVQLSGIGAGDVMCHQGSWQDYACGEGSEDELMLPGTQW